jgi:hypothetical protein
MVQTWYADDADAGGKFNAIMEHFAKYKPRVALGERLGITLGPILGPALGAALAR